MPTDTHTPRNHHKPSQPPDPSLQRKRTHGPSIAAEPQ